MLHAATAPSIVALAILLAGCGARGGGPDAGPTSAPAGARAAQARIAAGDAHTCVLRGGVVQCWGRNDQGQVGVERSPRVLRPTIVRGVEDATQIAARGDLTCAVSRDGSVTCWGVLGSFPLPRPELARGSDSAPRRVVGLAAVSKVGVGRAHVCALTRDGGLDCWGDLDVGGAVRSDTPVRMSTPERFVDLAVGEAVTCARTNDDRWLCWGRRPDEYGLMRVPGFGSDSTRPVEVPALRGLRELSIGSRHVCGIDGLGALKCSGLTSSLSDAVEVATSSTVQAPFTACVRRSSGEVLCWGGNSVGQTGVRGAALITTPTLVEELRGATALALGPLHGCAVLGDDSVQCFGANEHGERGTGRYGESDVRPRPALFDATAASIPTPACVTSQPPWVCELAPHTRGARLCLCEPQARADELAPGSEPRTRCWEMDLDQGTALSESESESESVVAATRADAAPGSFEIRRTSDSVTVCDPAGRCEAVHPPQPSELLAFGTPPVLDAALTSDGARVTFARRDRAHAHEVEEMGTMAPFFAETYDVRTHRRVARFFDATELTWPTGVDHPSLVYVGSGLQVESPSGELKLLDPLTGRARADLGGFRPEARIDGSRWAYLDGRGSARVIDVESGATAFEVPPSADGRAEGLLVLTPSRLVIASAAGIRVVDDGRISRTISLPRCR